VDAVPTASMIPELDGVFTVPGDGRIDFANSAS
jgi:hypothetical protein